MMSRIKKIGVVFFLLGVLVGCKSQIDVLAGSGVSEKKIALAYFQDQYRNSCNSLNFWVFNDGTVVYKSICEKEGTTEIEAKITSQEVNNLIQYIVDRSSQLNNKGILKNAPVTILKYANTKYVFNTTSANVAFKDINSKIENLINRTIN